MSNTNKNTQDQQIKRKYTKRPKSGATEQANKKGQPKQKVFKKQNN